jgi:hypothetical protein
MMQKKSENGAGGQAGARGRDGSSIGWGEWGNIGT